MDFGKFRVSRFVGIALSALLILQPAEFLYADSEPSSDDPMTTGSAYVDMPDTPDTSKTTNTAHVNIPTTTVPQSYESSSSYAWPAWIEVGGKIGDNRDLGSLDIFIPVYQNESEMWFADLRGKDANGPEGEWNVGGGYRRLMGPEEEPSWILGVYGFFDQLRSQRHFYYNQGSVGIEALTKDWDFRINGYFPEAGNNLIFSDYSDALVQIVGNSIQTSSTKTEILEVALPGFDAEIGFKIPNIDPDIRVYGGGFYFDRSDAERVAGPRGRVEFRIEDPFGWKGTRITVDGEYTYDDFRGSEYFAGASIRIPLDLSFQKRPMHPKNSLQARMIEPIIRDTDVVVSEKRPAPIVEIGPAINPFTGRAYSGIFFAEETGVGVGTETDPDDLTGAIGSAGVDGVVAALDTNGTINQPAPLANGMVLIGGGGTLPVRTPQGLNTSLVIPGGGPATINDAAGPVITLADENMVIDVTLDGGGDGIFGSGILSPLIREVTADGLGGDGFDVDNLTGDLLIEDSSFDGNTGDGINIDTLTGNVTILNTTSDGNGIDGLVVANVTGDLFVDPSSFSGNFGGEEEDTGVDIFNIGGNVTLIDVTADGNVGDGLLINTVGGDVLVLNGSFDGNTGGGINIANVVGGVDVRNVTGDGNTNFGLFIDTVGGNVSVDPSSFNGNGNFGVFVTNIGGDVSLQNVDANGNFNFGLFIDTVGGNVSVDPSSFNGNGNFGVFVTNIGGGVDLQDVAANGNTNFNLNIDSIGGGVNVQNGAFNGSTSSFGMNIVNVSGDVDLQNIDSNGNNSFNLSISSVGGNVSVDPSSFSGSATSFGISISSITGDVDLHDVTADGNNSFNLSVSSVGGGVDIQNGEFNGSATSFGVSISSITEDVTLRDVNANGNSGTNLEIDTVGGSVTIDPSSFNDSQNGDGIDINAVQGSVNFEDVTANDNDGDGIAVDSINSTLNFNNVTAIGNNLGGGGDFDLDFDNYSGIGDFNNVNFNTSSGL